MYQDRSSRYREEAINSYDQSHMEKQPTFIPPGPSQTHYFEFKITPGCLQIIFMLPFPFFCMGCSSCMSRSSTVNAHPTERVVRVRTYPGFLACLAEDYEIPYQDFVGLQLELVPNMRINNMPAFKLVINTRQGNIEISGAKMLGQILELLRELQATLATAGVVCKNRANIDLSSLISILY